jgi:hypothetical protein
LPPAFFPRLEQTFALPNVAMLRHTAQLAVDTLALVPPQYDVSEAMRTLTAEDAEG